MTEREVLERCACNKVRMASRTVTRYYDEIMRPAGLRTTQILVLLAVSMDGAISITALAKVLGMDRTTLKRNLGPLEKEGLVTLGAEGWHRSRTLELTKEGKAKLRKALPLWERAQDALMQKLGTGNWALLHQGLDRLLEAE